MGFLFPPGLLFLLLAVPIILLHALKVRREDYTVSSVFLWSRALKSKQTNTPWQKLKKNWLLPLQLLPFLIFCLVISQPFFESEAIATGNLVVLLDNSAGMQATDVTPNRFAKAKEEVTNLIEGMDSGRKMTLVLAHNYPEVIADASDNKNELKNALNMAKVTNELMNAHDAITLASTTAERTPGTTVVIVSSGSFAREENLPALKAKIKYIKVGESDNNQSITDLKLRESGAGPQLFARISNYSTNVAIINLQVTIDGKIFNAREISIEGNGKADLTLSDLPLDTRTVNVRIKPAGNAQDYLEIDNQAWAIRNYANPVKVLLVTSGNTFLDTIMARLPNYQVSKTDPNNYQGLKNKEDFDLFIFDEFAPDQLPSKGGIWLIGPPSSQALPVTGVTNRPVPVNLDQTNPLLRYTDLGAIDIASAKQYELPVWAKAVAYSDNGTPLLISGELQNQRIVALSFNLHNSNLALNLSWPILMVNTLGWLQPQGEINATAELMPGEPANFVARTANEVISVTPPSGEAEILKVTGNAASFTNTGQPGIYKVSRKGESSSSGASVSQSQEFAEYFVVSLISPLVSSIKPIDNLGLNDVAHSLGQSNEPIKNKREIWQPLALAALGLLMLEWYVSCRRKNPFFIERKASSRLGDFFKRPEKRDNRYP